MDYSAANLALWNPIFNIGLIAAVVLAANILRRKIPFIRNSMIPTAVLGGFLLLGLKLTGLLELNIELMEMLTYHCIAIGFIALTLRVPEETDKSKGDMVGFKSGAVIVSTYVIQGFIGLLITLGLFFTVMPDMFPGAGALLPMGYGQGPGQANNIGSSYEALGFAGGRSFGLALAAAGYICACVIGVIYINYLVRKGKLIRTDHEEINGSVAIDTFQSKGEIPIAESLDRLSVQAALVLLVYLITYLATWGLTSAFSALSPGVAATVNPLLWGFNFIIGSALAMLMRSVLKGLRHVRLMNHQYQNNYLLSRISGLAFDVMIVAGLASIEPEVLTGLWLPFLLLAVAGAIITLLHLKIVCRRVYGDYYYEGLVSMYGMLTGTISSGVLLLREIDPQLKTPAANNLVIGSSFAILLGIPMLLLIGLIPKSVTMALISVGALAVYYLFLMGIIFLKKKKKKA